ncbi:MAG: putative lipoprotein, partial [Pseudomonadota bacterium]
MGMWRAIIRPFLLIVGTMVASGCSHLAYQPSRFHYGYPERAKIHYEKVDFKSRDGTALTGWFFPAVKRNSRGPIPTVIQFHGNAENMTSHFFSLYWLIEAGYNVFTFDYRGYGRSEGSPDQAGVNLDVLAAIDYVRGRIPASNSCRDLILYGQSLGGAALARGLADLEDRSRISAVILEGSFYSYRKIAQDILRRVWLTYLFQHLAYVLVS